MQLGNSNCPFSRYMVHKAYGKVASNGIRPTFPLWYVSIPERMEKEREKKQTSQSRIDVHFWCPELSMTHLQHYKHIL